MSFPLRGGGKRKEGFERRSRSGAPLKNEYILLRNPRPLVSNPLLNDDVENIGAVNDRFLRRRAGVKFISTPCLYFTKKATEYLSPDVFNTKKSITLCDAFSALLAEREGFEPPEPRSSTVFKTAAIDHSAISPGAKVEHFFLLTKYFFKIFQKIFVQVSQNAHFQ